MAAAAGSTVNSLGTAQKDALRDQMGCLLYTSLRWTILIRQI